MTKATQPNILQGKSDDKANLKYNLQVSLQNT